ncbi:MAG: hypothetical protein M1826_000567 [Phylliscum demangeonii]|nr:MAG: hypothetical protein M1826_000567 [Phylliscum demangeonii]
MIRSTLLILLGGAMMLTAGGDAAPSNDETGLFLMALVHEMADVQLSWCAVCMDACLEPAAAARSGDAALQEIVASIPADVFGGRSCSVWCTGSLHPRLDARIERTSSEMESNTLRELIADHTAEVEARTQAVGILRQWVGLAKTLALASVKYYGCEPDDRLRRRQRSPTVAPDSGATARSDPVAQEDASQAAASLRTPPPPADEPEAKKARARARANANVDANANLQRARPAVDGTSIRAMLRPLVLQATNHVWRAGVGVRARMRMSMPMSMGMRAPFHARVEASASAPHAAPRPAPRPAAGTAPSGRSLLPSSLLSWTTRAAHRATRGVGLLQQKVAGAVRLGEAGLEKYVRTHAVVEP